MLQAIEEGRIPIGVMHRPKETTQDGLEMKLVPGLDGPARADIRVEPNLPAYQKLLAGMA